MCLGVPGKGLEGHGLVAIVDFSGLRRPGPPGTGARPGTPGVSLRNPVGFAIRRIPREEIGETLALYEQLLREAGEDIMAADVRGEIRATGGGTTPARP